MSPSFYPKLSAHIHPLNTIQSNSNPPYTRSTSVSSHDHTVQLGIVKPIDRLSLNTFSISLIPINPSDALKDLQWRNAIYDEYNALIKNSTWTLVPRPTCVTMVRSMWLFKHKFHANGTFSRYKAQLVANGSSQQLGINVDEPFSPVVKPATIRTVLSSAVSRKWPIHQLDIKNAFLNGDLSETVYMHQPPDFINSRYPHHFAILQGYFYLSDSMPLNFLSGLTWQTVCLYMHEPQEPHLAALKRILRCISETLDFGFHLYSSFTTSIVGYTDAVWADCPSTRRTTSGYCVFLGDNLLFWSSKCQPSISGSSAKAERRGVANVVAETASQLP
uniref:Ribonuclease H-like domain-containing protein n=1 Tax=Tanacetum cinerariifolium TaxID=118510 RepID=A0A6L2J832_TANCI|nr:ribonuclease H-like domain-containing protein [Tanacetum cinerariifolium]